MSIAEHWQAAGLQRAQDEQEWAELAAERTTTVDEVDTRDVDVQVSGPDYYIALTATDGSEVLINAEVLAALTTAAIPEPERCEYHGGCSNYAEAYERFCVTHTPSRGWDGCTF